MYGLTLYFVMDTRHCSLLALERIHNNEIGLFIDALENHYDTVTK